MSVTRSWRIAIHEAAHCIVARKLGLPHCGEATIEEPEPHAHFPIDHGARSIAALLAGACGEVVAFGDYDRVGIGADWERASARLERLGYDDNGLALWHWTVGAVRQHNGLITWCAVHLEHYRVLDGDSIDRMVRGWS